MNIFKNYKKYLYNCFLILVLNLIQFSTNFAYTNNYKINNIAITEPYDINFDKLEVIDKAFLTAFSELLNKTIDSQSLKKLDNIKINNVKKLVESFEIIEENFVNNNYSAILNVSFEKKKFLSFLEVKNIFSSIPINKKILFLPVNISADKKNVSLFSENKFFIEWNKVNQKYHLINYILPNEELDDLIIIKNNLDSIENYDFKELVSKYDLSDYIILMVFESEEKVKTLSRININNEVYLLRNEFKLTDAKNLKKTINKLKTSYEDQWKKINVINTSIKLNINISVNSKDYNTINALEESLKKIDLVSKFKIDQFSNKKIIYKITYNGTPDKFLSDFIKHGLKVNQSKEIWEVFYN